MLVSTTTREPSALTPCTSTAPAGSAADAQSPPTLHATIRDGVPAGYETLAVMSDPLPAMQTLAQSIWLWRSVRSASSVIESRQPEFVQVVPAP